MCFLFGPHNVKLSSPDLFYNCLISSVWHADMLWCRRRRSSPLLSALIKSLFWRGWPWLLYAPLSPGYLLPSSQMVSSTRSLSLCHNVLTPSTSLHAAAPSLTVFFVFFSFCPLYSLIPLSVWIQCLRRSLTSNYLPWLSSNMTHLCFSALIVSYKFNHVTLG